MNQNRTENGTHLPECVLLAVRMEYDDAFCICPELRVADQRVLDAARDAVARSCGHTKHAHSLPCAHDDAFAAIDELRVQRNENRDDSDHNALAAIDALRGES